MRQPFSGRTARRARLILILAALLAAAGALILAPPLALAAIAAAALLILLDRAALEGDLRALTQAIVADGPEGKLEVTDGAWGELCHALNRLRQQRRAQQQLTPMLPTLPAGRAMRLADAGIPADGILCEVAVLAVARPGGQSAALALQASARGAIDQLRESADAALHQAQLHDALLARSGGCLLLIFGAMGQQSLAATLLAAQQAARAIDACWAADPAGGRPQLTLAAGTARAIILPGLGYSVLGQPIEQALALQPLAAPAQLLCNEEAYLGLRRLGALPPHPAAPRLATADARPAYAVAL